MGGFPFRPAGLATIIGALPPLNPIDAARFVLDLVPRLPSAPLLGADGNLEPVRQFLEEIQGRVEPVVVSLTGPVTWALQLGDLEAAQRLVEERARELIALARAYVPDAPLMLFLQEPSLANSMHPTFPLEPDEIERLVADTVEPLTDDATVGVQVSGRADWAMLLRTGIGALGAPVTARLDTVAAELAVFLENGGVVAWGAVPVDEPLGTGVERLWRRLAALFAELVALGLDPSLLRDRSIVTPAAGLGDFALPQAERVVQLASELSDRLIEFTRSAIAPPSRR
ncbi:MAG TPA: hypothetical protein PKD80_08850 [Microthrixaceae bacterium]|nr:hypothetical protein [Microthrixaceae bacterium]HMT23937.1 hypothetical protein [Microthrixaceae bacterium]